MFALARRTSFAAEARLVACLTVRCVSVCFVRARLVWRGSRVFGLTRAFSCVYDIDVE